MMLLMLESVSATWRASGTHPSGAALDALSALFVWSHCLQRLSETRIRVPLLTTLDCWSSVSSPSRLHRTYSLWYVVLLLTVGQARFVTNSLHWQIHEHNRQYTITRPQDPREFCLTSTWNSYWQNIINGHEGAKCVKTTYPLLPS